MLIGICCFSSFQGVDGTNDTNLVIDSTPISAYDTVQEIQPGEEIILRWNEDSQRFSTVSQVSTTTISSDVLEVVTKAPRWLQDELLYQFEHISDPMPYICLLQNVSKQFTDEIAFSIAFSPIGKISSPEVLFDNAFWLYEIDKDLDYVDIIDQDSGDGSYYSTIEYNILRNGSSERYRLPKEFYYWYIVHPRLLSEAAIPLYESFWREYLYLHNDRGYPLLKEKIDGIQYLWDEQSYNQPGNRLWTTCISEHPTAIEAVSYWVGKTVPNQAVGDRPAQPNIVAHQHNGWCGELQRMALAAMRTLLIPTIGTCNIGEDHVWREFYHQGWHQNDNWWSDSGGTVDRFEVYAKNWGKDMSAVYNWKGDGSIVEVTDQYVPAEDLVTVTVEVTNGQQPYDGAMVTALVKGPKDITWYKNKILNELELFWIRLPEFIQNSMLKQWYMNLREKIRDIDDVIDGATATIWNYTNTQGTCSFQLGKHDEYLFLVQKPTETYNWPVSFHNKLRVMQPATQKTYRVFLAADYQKIPRPTLEKSVVSDVQCSYDIDSCWLQLQKNIRGGAIGRYAMNGSLKLFVVDQMNFERYQNGNVFSYVYKAEGEKMTGSFPLKDGFFVIIRNPTINTVATVDVSLLLYGESQRDNIVITEPSVSKYNHPMFSVGDQVKITGIATDLSMLVIDDVIYDLEPGRWEVIWDTFHIAPGMYELKGICGACETNLMIELVDVTTPNLDIHSPIDFEIVNPQSFHVSGTCSDESGIEEILVSVDDTIWHQASGKEQWHTMVSFSNYTAGVRSITVKAIDHAGNSIEKTVSAVINETTADQKPVIHEAYHQPNEVNNKSNVIVYANVSSSLFPLRKVMISYIVDSELFIDNMYQYAAHPVQSRHHEDPLFNQSNEPVFGKELGQFPEGTTISYQIIATDVSMNTVESSEYTLTVS